MYASPGDSGVLTCLIVEDNPGDVRLLETYLENADTELIASEHECHHARTLEEAAAIFEAEDIDLVLLDLGLPRSTGLATLERAHEFVADVPIVVLTGLDNQATAVQAIQEGAQDYLNKNRLDGDVLVRAIRYAIERKQNERELERTIERLDEFASIVTHDLRNPLNVAAGRLELARETGADEHFEAVSNAHDRIDSIIADVLAMARQGADVESVETVELCEAASTAWRTVSPSSATLVVDADRQVTCDGSRLGQLLENLFGNAVEHGGADVTVRVGGLPDGFFVADDGPGIPAGEREAVFEAGHSASADGTGFGLAIVEQIAAAHGWQVAATESEAGGARFEVTGLESVAGPLEEQSHDGVSD